MRVKAYITGKVLRWSRETAKYSILDVSLKMKCPVKTIDDWENEKEYPTIKQAEELSKIYRRPLAIFFLPEPPTDFQTLRDFRRNIDQSEYSTALVFIIREIQQKQNWIREILVSDGEPPLDFIGRYNVNSPVKEIADDIINEIGLFKDPFEKDVLEKWINKVESRRIFVCRSGNIHSHLPLDIEDIRGFAVCDRIAPFIFINSKDSKNGQLFSLIHELAHIWIDSSGVSSFKYDDFSAESVSGFDPIEVLCNRVAAEILMPEVQVRSIMKHNDIMNLDNLDNVSKELNVSSYALIVRLLNFGIINYKVYNNYKEVLENRYNEFVMLESKKKKKGGPDWYFMQVRRNSKALTHLVFSLYKGGKISGTEASSVLNVKINKFSKMEGVLHKNE